ncbi:CDP-glycerol glycerophosphotransferase family protein [Luteimicrobium sp. NPDC057192]|uniref:CDP-glycerol glycerophosphotransferase family protein n=1 Tax=Luteimicrobium sp. NPDC057192 TaxID=3346042 RepID=UPI003645CF2C
MTNARIAALAALGVGALVLAALGAPPLVVAALVAVAGALEVVGQLGPIALRSTLRTPDAVSRAAAAAAALAALVTTGVTAATVCAGAAAVVALGVVWLEGLVGYAWREATRVVERLPGYTAPHSLGARQQVITAGWYLAVVLATLTADGRSGELVLGLAALVVALGTAAAFVLVTRAAIRAKATVTARIAQALRSYDAPVMVYLSGPEGTEYQLGVWLRTLERLSVRLVVVVRETALARVVAGMTSLPVVSAPAMADLEGLQVETFRVALYVNNGAKNGHNVRYRELTHVQLLHGDSDKPSSYNPVTAMFDKIFVAGQAGIDRYAAHGVEIPADKFVVVGRPQVADIAAAAPGAPLRTVLYAPTWTGFNQDNDFGSLDPTGPAIVRALLARGWTVVFRPHPYSLDDARSLAAIEEIHQLLEADAAASGHEHVFGDRASSTMSIVDCFNLSDALVSDVSSVPADYLYSAKPFVITQVDDGPSDAFLDEFPLARASYVARLKEPGSLEAALDALEHDASSSEREAMRSYYLGDFPRDEYADVFGRAVEALVASRCPAPAAPVPGTPGGAR